MATSQPDAPAPVVFYDFPDIGYIEYMVYTWNQGDRLDNLAMKYYGHPERWWIILSHNPEIIDINNIAPGTKLRLPRVQ